ncbi:magnesium transporter CorA family protein [Svornostia abyssi]|uniref:Magnesium transporter CorA family protein n=1 Tax=Svornostia abyssi TaxID=2898438 RepID=A0ABY5PFI7_9ACTN|nr:magnesium transporter CorA family protein [Parviterribacteraceae bacterium J379]
MAAHVFTELTPEVDALVAAGEFVWVEIHDPDDTQIDRLAQSFSLHPLSVTDLREFGQRGRLERFGDHLGGVFYGAHPDGGTPQMREVHFFASAKWLVTVHREPIPQLHELRDRVIEVGMPEPSMLLYKLFDTLTESFFPAIERIDDEIDDLESAIVESADQAQVEQIVSLRRVLVEMRRVISPQRDMLTSGGELLADIPGTNPYRDEYFRDVRDHLIRVSEMIDAQRDLLAGAMDLYLSAVSYRQGEINKQLTLIATIFLPLTFITGFFGQNFGYMVADLIRSPAVFWVFGVGSLVVSGLGLLVWFRRQGWT